MSDYKLICVETAEEFIFARKIALEQKEDFELRFGRRWLKYRFDESGNVRRIERSDGSSENFRRENGRIVYRGYVFPSRKTKKKLDFSYEKV